MPYNPDNPTILEYEVMTVKRDIDMKAKAFMAVLEDEFAPCFQSEINFNAASCVPDDMHMVIQTVPGYTRPYLYRVPEAYEKHVTEKIQEMVTKGMLRVSSSAYARTAHCVYVAISEPSIE